MKCLLLMIRRCHFSIYDDQAFEKGVIPITEVLEYLGQILADKYTAQDER